MSILRKADAPRSGAGISRMRAGRPSAVRMDDWTASMVSKTGAEWRVRSGERGSGGRVAAAAAAAVVVDVGEEESVQANISTLLNSWTRYKPRVSTPRAPASAR